ncbi:hypothetical protein [Mesorhizobium sp. L2C084A000]|uniref:hypothetical protein n=1 Tax=Mesorhizobium sp. L2C084A000 TaxID=1287116 RepID=UPI0003D016B7|nr:hypothetical protein [Mesorhizobium sp. L2C084A000]ESZ24255.1 hypothetical protein X734_23395 [Mesorhizobium sp. L2C084A000]
MTFADLHRMIAKVAVNRYSWPLWMGICIYACGLLGGYRADAAVLWIYCRVQRHLSRSTRPSQDSLKVLLPLVVLASANGAFHFEAH